MPSEPHYGPVTGDRGNVTAEAKEAYRLLKLLGKTQRGLVLCWFCQSCYRFTGLDNCTCESDK